MKIPSKYKPHIKVRDVSKWLNNSYIRHRTQFVVTPEGECFYLVEGVRIPCKDFESKFPVTLKPVRNEFGLPIDSRSNFY